MNRFGLGMGGQREFTPTNEITELRIPLKHLAIGWVAGVVALFILQRSVVIPITLRWCGENAVKWQLWIWRTAMVVWTVVVLRSLALGFLAQFHDPRLPAPYAQRQAGDPMPRPMAPGWVARGIGWRSETPSLFERLLDALLPSSYAAQDAEQQLAESDAEPDRIIEASIMLHDAGGHKHRFANLRLPLSDWRLLARYIDVGGRSVSVGDLERAGFAKGAHGSARRVNSAISGDASLYSEGRWRKPIMTEDFAAWVMLREFEEE